MKKKLLALTLGALMLCALSVPALAADQTPLPDSELYCGEIAELITGADGDLTALRLTSSDSGEYVMNLSDTVYIDSARRTASDPATLKTGETVYVFHSPVSTRSLPPQSAALAMVRNVPQDVSCARYLKVEAIETQQDGVLQITTDNGGMYLFIDGETPLSAYAADTEAALTDIRVGGHIMAWYDVVALSYPGQARPSHVMVLPEDGSAPLTRSAFAVLLHTAAGSPVVNYAMRFTDVSQDAPYAEAVRWAASEKLLTGYTDGRFGPDDVLTREQLTVVLWRRAGSPMLMDYPGLTGYADAKDIARYAQSAFAWAHQKGLLPAGSYLNPKAIVSRSEAKAMIAALEGK